MIHASLIGVEVFPIEGGAGIKDEHIKPVAKFLGLKMAEVRRLCDEMRESAARYRRGSSAHIIELEERLQILVAKCSALDSRVRKLERERLRRVSQLER